MKKKLFFLSLIFSFNLLNAQTTILLNPVQDNTIYESVSGDISNGAGDHIFAGTNNAGLKRRALLLFDFSSIPTGSVITDVSLTLTADQTTSGTYNMSLYPLTDLWGEGTSNAGSPGGSGAAATTADATWLYSFYPVFNWANAGGDFDPTALATTPVNGNGSYIWNSNQMISYVQDFVDGTGLNLGWILIGDESTNQTAKRFGSRENVTPSSVPSLSITYTSPCASANISSLSASSNLICNGSSSTITVNGSISDNTLWHLYSAGCGITAIDSNSSGVFSVSPSATTAYYIRGEGGCASNGLCSDITVTVNNPAFFTQNVTICNGSNLTIGSSTYNASGTYTDILTGTNTCDSTVTTNLTVLSPITFSQTLTICAGSSITLGLSSHNSTGIYTDIVSSFLGCDSTVTTDLTVLPANISIQAFTICSGSSVSVGSSTYSTSGSFTDLFTAADGCDSTIITNLTVLPDIITNQHLTVCVGSSITIGTNIYNSTGTYTDILTATNSCDSTVITNLVVLSPIVTNQTITLCDGGNLTVGSNTYSSSGVFNDVLASYLGCDSTVTTNLTILAPISFSQTLTLCAGSSLTIGGNIHNSDGTYSDVLESSSGCDSTVTTNLTILPANTSSQSITICHGTSLTVGSSSYSTNGIYTDDLLAFDGCDSTVTTFLTVLSANTTSQIITLCEGFSVTVGSNVYSTTGVYSDVFAGSNSCDSTIITDLTIIPEISTTQNITVCFGQDFNAGIHNYTVSGVYIDTLTAHSGCDSLLTTNLTVLPQITSSQTLTICAGGTVTVGTSTYNTSGTYSDVLPNVNGCDSTVTTNLTVNPILSGSQTITICNGSVFSIGTSTYNSSGTFTDILTNSSGCDSVVTTNLTVLPSLNSSQSFTICSGSAVTVGSATHTTSGTFIDILTAFDGCDSTVTSNLTVLPGSSSSQTLTICGGTSISVGSFTHNASGTYTDVLANFSSNGCDSTVTTNLTVLPVNSISQSFTVCFGGSITVGTSTYNSSGTYTDIFTAANGCDSIVSTTVLVNPAITGNQTLTICAGSSITVGSVTHSNSGIFIDVLSAANGCDSTVTTSLTVSPSINTNQTLVVCAGGSVTIGSSTHTTSGTYSDILTAADGCDSTVTTNLIVSLPITNSQSFTVCSGGTITVGTSTYNTSGTYTNIFTAYNGCDSTVTTNLTVSPAISHVQSFTVCAGGSISVGTSTYNASGSYTDIFTAHNGCDSTVTTNLTVSPAITGSQTLTVCHGGSITVGSATHSTSGTFTDILIAHNGCDSTVTTNLTVRPAITGSQTLSVCFGGIVTVGSSTHNTSGTFTDVLTAHNGCDSTVTTNLTVRPAITGSQTLSVCFGGSVTVGSSTHTTSGTFIDILTAHNGCDSTVTTNLTVQPAITGSQLFSICSGGSIQVGTSTYTASGTYVDILSAHNGCDSTVTTGLTVRPAITGSQTLTVCAGGSISVGSATHNTSGTFTDVLAAFDGCDSTVTTNLTVSPAITNIQTVTLCAGGSITIGSSIHTSSGIFTDVLSAHNGCDSTLITNLTVSPAITGSQTLTLCAGASVNVGSSTYTTSGTFTDILTATNGCDSTVTSNITVNSAISATQTITLCSGDSIIVGANTYNTDGTYTDVLVSVTGCDSTVTTNLTVNFPIITSQVITVCDGDSITVGNNTYTTSGNYTDIFVSISGCDSTVSSTLIVSSPISGTQTVTICNGASLNVGSNTYTSSGTYSDILIAFAGCDSTVTTNLTVSPAITGSDAVTICAGTSITIGGNTYTSSGVYSNIITAFNGCDSTLTTTLTVSPAITHTQTYILCHGGSVFVGPNQYTATGIYTDVLTAHNGCDSILTTNLTVNAAPVVTMTPFPATICAEDAPFVLTNGSPAGGIYSGIGITSSPTFNPMGSGIGAFVITYTYTNAANGCSGSDTASIRVKTCAGIEEYSFAESLNIYPNPSGGLFNISIGNAAFDALYITVYDIQGREVYNETDKNISSDYNKQISIDGISKGMYYLRLSDGTNAKVQKIIIE